MFTYINFHVISPNATTYIQRNWIKRFYRAHKSSSLEKKVQNYKDESGMHFINFDFMSRGQEIKVSIVVELSCFLVVILSF